MIISLLEIVESNNFVYILILFENLLNYLIKNSRWFVIEW